MEIADVGAVAEALDGVGVAERHAADGAADGGRGGDVLHHALDGARGERRARFGAGKDKAGRGADSDTLAEDAVQGLRNSDVAVDSRAVVDVEELALQIDVLPLKVTELAHAEATAVEQPDDEAVAQCGRVGDHTVYFGVGEYFG